MMLSAPFFALSALGGLTLTESLRGLRLFYALKRKRQTYRVTLNNPPVQKSRG